MALILMTSPKVRCLVHVPHIPMLSSHKQFHNPPTFFAHQVWITCTVHILGIQLQAHDKASVHQKVLENRMQGQRLLHSHESKL